VLVITGDYLNLRENKRSARKFLSEGIIAVACVCLLIGSLLP
jgi:hypothetical protein